jgi:hypothetical protein
MKLNRDAVPFLVHQRTEYADAIERMYATDMQALFENIRPHFPTSMNTIMDIGSGMAGIDILIAKSCLSARFTLFDMDGNDGNKVGWHENVQSFGQYHSFEALRQLITGNNLPDDRFDLVDGRYGFPDQEFDLVMSFLSWGFHYPIETYLDRVHLSDGGVMIVDVRSGTGGIETLHANFPSVEVIHNAAKHQRVVCHK